MDHTTFSRRYILQNLKKFTESKVCYLAAPQFYHPLQIKVFKDQNVIEVSQLMSQLEKPVTTPISYSLVFSGSGILGQLSIVRSLLYKALLSFLRRLIDCLKKRGASIE